MSKNKIGQVWVSSILYFSLAFIIIILVLNFLAPTLDNIKANSELKIVENEAKKFDTILKELIKEGKGAQKIIDLDVENANVVASEDSLKIVLSDIGYNIKEKKISDNVIISNRDEVMITENSTHYNISNSLINMIIRKYGNSNNYVSINTSQIITEIRNLEKNVIINSNFTFFVGNQFETASGVGYTELIDSDVYGAYAKVNVYVYNNIVNYMFSIVLESNNNYVKFLGPYFI